MNKIGIVGLGLIGGSLAIALKEKSSVRHIVAMDLNENALHQAFNDGVINSYTTTIDEKFSDCDIIFLCTPVNLISDYVNQLLPYVNENCILTDVGSTKQAIMTDLKNLKSEKDFCFIGGHPMTGSEKAGYMASRGHLFENAYYILTPEDSTSQNQLEKLKKLIYSIEAIPLVISPEYHDLITAAISHVPHIIASSLVNMVKNLDNEDKYMNLLAAGGFKDITRIASSSPEIWHNICMTNQNNIRFVLDYFIQILKEFSSAIEEQKDEFIWNFFDSAKQYRKSFSDRSPGPLLKSYEIIVDVVDQPGIIANIAVLLSKHNINIKNIGIINNREHENGALQIIFDKEEDQKKSIKLLKDMNYNIYEK